MGDTATAALFLACFCTHFGSVAIVKNYALMQSRSDHKVPWFFLLGLVVFVLSMVLRSRVDYRILCVAIAALVALILLVKMHRIAKLDTVFPAGRAS